MKFIKNNPTNTLIALLTIIYTTNIFSMRMTMAGKARATKYIQYIKEQQKKIANQIETAKHYTQNIKELQRKMKAQIETAQKYTQKIKELHKKLTGAIIPVRSFQQTPTTKPVIFYEPNNKRIVLDFVKDNKLQSTLISPTQVNSYNFSPQKKYLIFQTTTQATQTKSSFIGKIINFNNLINQLLETLLRRKISENIAITNVTKIVDLQTQTEICSLDGDLITYEFSPDETTILISRRHLGEKLSNKGASTLRRPQNDTTRYELFDITSKSILKTFENIQTINYTTEDNLIAQYDDETIEQITIQRNKSLSLAQRFMSIFTPQSSTQVVETKGNIQNIPNKITYYDATKELYLNLPQRNSIKIDNILSYALSPLKNYLILFKEKAMANIINMQTGRTIENISHNIITYEFNPYEKESCLNVLGSSRDYFTGEKILYSLVKLEKNKATSLITFNTDNTFYYKSTNELVVINKDGTFTSYNPKTGITLEQEQQQKRRSISQEIPEQIRLREKRKKEQEQKIQKQQEEFSNKEQLRKKLSHFKKLIQKAINLNFTTKDIKWYGNFANEFTQENITLEKIDDINKIFSNLEEVINCKEKDKRLETEQLHEQLKKDLPHLNELIQIAINLELTDDIGLLKELVNKAAQENITLEQIDDINDTFSKLENVIKCKEEDKRLEAEQLAKEKKEKSSKPKSAIENLMDYFNTNQEKSNIDAIITNLSKDSTAHRYGFLEQYNKYDNETKKKFASYFFAPSYGALKATNANGIDFQADAFNNAVHITNKTTGEISVISEEDITNVYSMIFSANDDYLAVSYEGLTFIDIFRKQLELGNDTFSFLKRIKPSEFAPIIGLKFITTTNNNTYIFFIDSSYKMGNASAF